MDKKPLIGIAICMLLIVNVSAVLGIPEEKTNTIEKTESFAFVKLFDQEDLKYTILDTDVESEMPVGNLVGPNLAPNPSFEEGDTMPMGWTYDPYSNGTYHWDSNFARSGMKSIGVLNLTDTTWEGVNWKSDFIPVDFVMNSYMFLGWFKFIGVPADQQYAFLHIIEYDENYHLLGGGGHLYRDAPEWTRSVNDTTHMNDHRVKYVQLVLGQECFSEPDPSVEVRFDDVYFGIWNTVPNTPIITGETHGRVKSLYPYIITTIDPDQNNVTYLIDWDDNTTQTTAFYNSGEEVNVTHIWGIRGTYSIKVKAIDEYGAESNWATLSVAMPYSYNIPLIQFWERLLERFPNVFPILRHLMLY